MRHESYRCDVCKATISTAMEDINKKDGAKKSFQHAMQVIFITETCEGYPCKPYFANQSLDLCKGCLDCALGGKYIFAKGAQGYNEYFFKNNKGEG